MIKIFIRNRISEHLAFKARREGRERYTQDDLVEATKLSRQTISTHLNNKVKRYDVRTIETWCEFLDITPDQFFSWSKIETDPDDTESNENPVIDESLEDIINNGTDSRQFMASAY